MGKIKETFVATVEGVSREQKYLNGYGSPVTKYTELTIKHDNPLRSLKLTIPGDVPLGTQFQITIEQIDDVTPALIQRGSTAHIIDAPKPQAQLAPVSAPEPIEPSTKEPLTDIKDMPF